MGCYESANLISHIKGRLLNSTDYNIKQVGVPDCKG